MIQYKRHIGLQGKYDEIEIYTDYALVNGAKVTGYQFDQVLGSYFSHIVDMDSWKHSWHLPVSKFRNIEIRKKIADIISEKIEKRQKELKSLSQAQQLLISQIPFMEDVLDLPNNF